MKSLRLYKVEDRYIRYLHSRDNRKIKSGKHILKLKNGEYGMLGFNNMIPVHKDALIEFDINSETDEKYRRLLQRQVDVCNRMKADILDHAQKTYFDVTTNRNDFLVSISCDFKTDNAK